MFIVVCGTSSKTCNCRGSGGIEGVGAMLLEGEVVDVEVVELREVISQLGRWWWRGS